MQLNLNGVCVVWKSRTVFAGRAQGGNIGCMDHMELPTIFTRKGFPAPYLPLQVWLRIATPPDPLTADIQILIRYVAVTVRLKALWCRGCTLSWILGKWSWRWRSLGITLLGTLFLRWDPVEEALSKGCWRLDLSRINSSLYDFLLYVRIFGLSSFEAGLLNAVKEPHVYRAYVMVLNTSRSGRVQST